MQNLNNKSLEFHQLPRRSRFYQSAIDIDCMDKGSSYRDLPESKVKYPLDMKEDSRGSFTEILKTVSSGQFSVNITRPGVTKGQHWHNSKWELFIVVSGKALIRERRIGSDEIMEFKVSGDKIEAVHMIPGYTHELINLSDSEDLVTLMWANEIFDPSHPDTFHEEV